VIGIATDRPVTLEIGWLYDIAYLNMPEWTDEDEAKATRIQNELGYFKNAIWSKQ